MVYGIIELINFAHGEIFMVGSFVCWWLLTTLGFTGAIQRSRAPDRSSWS